MRAMRIDGLGCSPKPVAFDTSLQEQQMNRFQVTIVEVAYENGASDIPISSFKRYEGTVDTLDINAVILAVNRKPRAPRNKKPKLDEAKA
jgi:hypothetical protein